MKANSLFPATLCALAAMLCAIATAQSTIKRSMSAPDIPTLDESGVKGYQTKSWNALVAPRGMPATIIQRLNRELNAVLNTPAVADRIKQQGIEPEPGTPEELAGYVREEIVRFRNLIAAIGLKPE